MDGSGRGSSAWAEAGAVLDRAIEATREASGRSGDAPLDAASIVNQAALIAFCGGLRYWSELAVICTRRRSALARTLLVPASDIPETERRAMIEDLRGLAREFGDLALREARRLQTELDDLALRLASTVPEATPTTGPRRYARAKP